MKAIIVMYDTLCRKMLQPYGNDWTKTPNFLRLAERAATFDKAYIGSAPTMPARREMHTGRYNFLHRSWGPLEPFDDSMPELLRNAGIYCSLISDCQHYWEDGGATYHSRYNTWRFSRGQEGDAWMGVVHDSMRGGGVRIKQQDALNRPFMRKEEDWPQAKTFRKGLEFIKTNRNEDNWLLHLETFDPHEPWHAPRNYLDLFPHEYGGPPTDWPDPALERTEELFRHYRCLYAGLLAMCDANLGKVLDLMDEYGMWDDTMLIVNTDHGFLLGEHGLLGKIGMSYFEEIANIPLFIWDPRARVQGERRGSLAQTIDIAPTLLQYFGVPIPPDMQGRPLDETIAEDKPVREAALYGTFGGHVFCVDGRYCYRRPQAADAPRRLYDFTLMCTHMRSRFSPAELKDFDLAGPFSFTKGCRVLRIPFESPKAPPALGQPTLWDLLEDPGQERPIGDPEIELRMIDRMIRLMKDNAAPPEQFARLGLAE